MKIAFPAFCLFVFAIIGLEPFVYSQTNYKTPVMLPAPTSSVFLRYGADQPSLQTGTINIPISLFNIQAKGMNIPLTLTYQTSGINIWDSPYPAGYGWVFSPAFRITRVVLGRSDERFQFNSANGIQDYETIKRGILDEGIANLHGLTQGDLFDTQKDIFTLHLPSGSYNFFINSNGSTYDVVSIGHHMKIEPQTGTTGLMGFKVTDDNGIVYMFGYNASTSFLDFTEPTNLGAGYSAWMLREIVLTNGEKLNFTWQKTNTSAYAPKVYAPISIKDRKDADCDFTDPYEIEDMGGVVDHASYSGANAMMLKRIDYPDGVIDMAYKSTSDPFLQSITVKNKYNEVIKIIGLTYGTSTFNASNCLLNSLTLNAETYNFEYNSNYFGPWTTGLDYWGYYNGKTSNANLIPRMKLKIFTGASGAPIYEEFGTADRSVSAEHMKAFMLTKITYPTGGYSQYEYEPHQFPGQSNHTGSDLFYTDPDPISVGGGLRVSEIKTYSAGSGLPLVKTFKYGPGENGLANPPVVPTLETFIDETGQAKELDRSPPNCPNPTNLGGLTWKSYRNLQLNPLSNYSKFLINKNPIWYSNVTEYINNEQKTTYAFSYDETYQVSWETNLFAVKSPYAFRYDNLFNKGPILTGSTVYKKSGGTYNVLQQTVHEYERIQNVSQNVSGVIIDRKGLFLHLNLTGVDLYPPTGNYPSGLYPACPSFTFPGDYNYKTLPYSIAVQYDRLKKTTTTSYDNNGQDLVTYQNMLYNGNDQLKKLVKGTSISGKEIFVEYTYPNELTDAVSVEMTARNMLAPVITEKNYKKESGVETLLLTTQTNYRQTGDLILKDNVQASMSSLALETRVLFNQYDAKANLVEQQQTGDVKEIYLWGYHFQYPVAKVIGSDYNTVKGFITQSILDNTGGTVTDQQMRDELQKIRTGLAGTQALVTTYTYKPLVGMTSETDAGGRTTYYEYDNFQRLTLVRDQDRNIIKQYCYNYAGTTPVPCSEINTTPNWVVTGNSRCVVVNNSNTGEQEVEQHDGNPNSNLGYRWVSAGTNTTACPLPSPTVYARLSYENVYTTFDGYQYADVVVRTYSDSDCTQPTSVNNLTINYTVDDSCSSSAANNQSMTGSLVYLSNSAALVYANPWCGDVNNCPCFVNYYLDQGTGYIIR